MIKQVLFWVFLSTMAFGQASEFNVNWTNHIPYTANTSGEFKTFIGTNNQLIFGYFTPTIKKNKEKTVYLCAFDKVSMARASSITVTCPEKITQVKMNNEHIFLITEKYEDKTLSVGCMVLNSGFKTLIPHKTIYKQKTFSKYTASSQYNVVSNPKANDYLYILAEKPAVKNEKIMIEYVVFDAQLNTKYTGQQELPVVALSTTANGNTKFSVGDDGLIIAKNQVKADKNTRMQEKIFSYALLTAIQPEKKTAYTIPLRASGKDIEDYIFISEKNRLKIYGIYTGKDDKGKFSGEKGIFMTTYNTLNNDLEQTNFQKVKGYDADFESLSLDQIKSHPDGSVSIIGSESTNTIYQSRSSTTYTNSKGDIYVANITKNGEVRWEKALPRFITYSDLFVDDLKVATHDKKLYIVYSDEYTKKERKKASMMGDKRTAKDMRDFLSYYTLDLQDGKSNKKELKMNNNATLTEDIRTINSSRIIEFDNAFFLDGFNTQIKSGVTKLACGTSCLLGAGCIYYSIKYNNGSAFKGGGSLGSITFK